MGFLGNLSSAKSRVYISVTPGIGLEMLQLDLNANVVANYAVRDFAYNESLRTIDDFEAFKDAVSDMYGELGINPKTEVVVNMPLVSFGQMQLGLLLPNDAITGAIQSELEQTFIFRRFDPAVAWIDAPSSNNSASKETRTVIYSAIQQVVIEKLSAALSELGSVLVSVENSLSSTFRALDYMGLVSAQLQPNVTWNLLIVNSTGYSIASMTGKTLIEYYEDPLPIKSFEGDEIYNAIVEQAQIALMNYPANYLYVVSDTDMVSAELLASKLSTTGIIDYLENNSFKKESSLIPVSLNVLQGYASKISLQAIGCALADVSDFPLKFNYMEAVGGVGTIEDSCTIAIGEHEYTITKNTAMAIAAGVGLTLVAIMFLLGNVLLPNSVQQEQNKLNDVNTKLEELNGQLNEGGGAEVAFDATREVENGVKGNRAKLMNYIAAGETIPQNVWLTYFMTQGNGLVDIKGGATDVSSVYTFFKNMRDSLIGTKLKLQKLEMDSVSVDAAVAGAGSNYSFEITNMTEDQLNQLFNPPVQCEEGDEECKAKQAENQAQQEGENSDLLGPEIH